EADRDVSGRPIRLLITVPGRRSCWIAADLHAPARAELGCCRPRRQAPPVPCAGAMHAQGVDEPSKAAQATGPRCGCETPPPGAATAPATLRDPRRGHTHGLAAREYMPPARSSGLHPSPTSAGSSPPPRLASVSSAPYASATGKENSA